MSLPPQIVRVKRKASEAPVEFLRVHETAGKRQRRANDFVFSRQQNPETTNDSITSSLAPHAQSVRPIKAIHRTPSAQSPATQTAQVNTLTGSSSKQLESAIAPNGEPVSRKAKSTQGDVQRSSGEPQLIAQPRRFHISRPQTSPSEPVTNLRRKRGVREEPVFVERRVRPRTSDETSTQNVPTATDLSMPSFDTATQPRTQKKPGLAKRGSIAKNDTPIEPKQSSPAPPPIRKLTIPSNYANTDEFLKQMQDYTLQEIGHSISQSKAFGSGTTTPESTPRKPQKSRFTPKKPALRFHERHPEMLNTAAAMDVDQLQYEDQEDTEDDSEYIIDTYIRIPAGSMEADDTPKDFGLLVLDSQPDIEEFYREHDDSEEEEEDEEEDENAENHYSADYPDEEVDTDDEYGRNAYNYRNYNASDLEEFDEDDATFSDEDNDDTKYPWSKKPLWLTRSVTEEEMKDEGDV